MRQYLIECFLLHLRHYRETSVIVTALSLELGKVSFVVKGVRNKKNPTAGLLQPFVPLQLQLSGQGELKNGNKVEMSGRAFSLQGNCMYSGMYLNEILIRTLPVEEAVPELYQQYIKSLQSLASAENVEPTLRCFEFRLLQELGYGIDFNAEAQSQQPIASNCFYRFDPEQGFVLADSTDRNTVSGTAILQIEKGEWSAAALKTAKYVARCALTPLLGNKPLKSRELFR